MATSTYSTMSMIVLTVLLACTFSCQGHGCSRNPCGTNALCRETVGGRPVCSCPSGYSGNPATYCRRPECLDHTECRGNNACRSGSCVNPCIGSCGQNANCEVRNHVATCSCPAGYKGDPFSYCRRVDPGIKHGNIFIPQYFTNDTWKILVIEFLSLISHAS